MPTMKNYRGVIIEESLADKKVLGQVKITSTRVSVVTPKHATPWLKKWTLHTVEIEAKKAGEMARELSKSLDSSHSSWYADFHNEADHYIVYQGKVLHIDMKSAEQYEKAKEYGISLGIPEYQVDFKPSIGD